MPVQWEQENIAVPSGALTTYTAQLPARAGAHLICVMASPSAGSGPYNALLGFGDSGQGFFTNLLKTGWMRSDANNLSSDLLVWNGELPIDTIAARPVVSMRVRNDTGTAGTVLINYAYEVPG